MKYVAKVRTAGATRFGYGETEYAAVLDAVSAMPAPIGKIALLMIYAEDASGEVTLLYAVPCSRYLDGANDER